MLVGFVRMGYVKPVFDGLKTKPGNVYNFRGDFGLPG